MRIEPVSPHIWSLTLWVLIPIRIWIVVGKEGVTLIDAGLSPMAKGILRFVERLDAGPIQRILLTHGHADHVGAIAKIVHHRPAPVFVHPIEIPYMEGRLPYPGRKKLKASVAAGVARALPGDADGSLHPIGGLQPFLTPGHSPGHVVYYHPVDRVLLAGDLFTSRGGQLRPPIAMFTSDMEQAVQSSRIVQQLDPERLEVSHGGPVLRPADQLDVYLEAWGRIA